ncbi:HlyD family efflux transporter periplasmic adaptor subunit [Parvibaculum sedimenti]|uniref:HlyD family efflux transporter periplasmic adaptor subunit n=1 Tax=Parvibaculum sedimenti TaxID=2608632 RepID=A0A6N6VDF6_9HYPH|nr:HlyD family efflux transporter periplasmic adaptor subunit [Parvibaculum sedimenti]KAB7738590.1 HlyD family efflux transporter periplasmic adaptor subunit [Parvibaculum sedimenti]
MSYDSNILGRGTPRQRGLALLGIIVIAGILVWAGYWFVFGGSYQSTDDAYVAGDVVQITAEQPGTVQVLSADDTQSVKRGQALVTLDPSSVEIALQAAEADLARTVRQVRAQFAKADALRADIAQREVAVRQAESDLKRRRQLAGDGAVSGEELAHARDAVAAQEATLSSAKEQLNATLAAIDGTSVSTNPDVLAAAARVRDAALGVRRTHIVSPVNGLVARRTVQLGQHVAAGAPLMAVVPLEDVWVDANFKEGQLANLRVGQPVTLEADIYGGDVTYHGHVVGVSAGSGSAFALLPPQNASGNWIKIVQRLPVRIALDPAEVRAHPLRIGLSVSVKVDVRDTSGPLVASEVRSVPLPPRPRDDGNAGIEQTIERIVADNGGGGAVSAAARLP